MKYSRQCEAKEAVSGKLLIEDPFLPRSAARFICSLAVVLLLSLSAEAATFLVTNTNDSGPGSLRQAILDANGNSGAGVINFQIATGPQTIVVATMLPGVSNPTIIDGTTQPGYTGTPLIEVSGNNAVQFGIELTGGNSTIKGLAINGFTSSGILLFTHGGNNVANCYIGTSLDGANSKGNAVGISIEGGSDNNTIGGLIGRAGNLISGNQTNGVQVFGGSGNFISGNFIGTNAAGTAALGNGAYGIRVLTSNNTIGGGLISSRNVISGNYRGISVDASGSANLISSNFIGTNFDGTTSIPNSQDGIQLTGSNNTVGGASVFDRNVISGNGANGILINGSPSGNHVLGNFIGTTSSGSAALGNDSYGIRMIDVVDTIIGGTTAGARNVISGNGRGISLEGVSSGNLVQGNFIGVDATGSVKIANHGSGIDLFSASNTVGGVVPGAGNVISGNDGAGVGVSGSAAHDNKIQGNILGLNANGTAPLGNGTGITIIDASNTFIGSTVPEARNIISANFRGITIDGTGSGNVVEGNYIGTDITGTVDLGNNQEGISIGGANNAIGGTVPGAGNLISGNDVDGMRINGTAATGNQVQGNFIGTKANGTDPLPNTLIGIEINGSFNNLIGGTLAGAGNTVADNGYAGVVLSAGTGNAILGNSMFGNARLGIELSGQDAIGLNVNDPGDPDSGANWTQNYPLLTSVIASGGNTSIKGKLNSNPNKAFRIEFFSNTSCDGTGFGEGQTFIGTTLVGTDGNGDALIDTTLPLTPAGQFITATATSAGNDTSEFSPCALVGGPNPGALQFESSFFLVEEFQGTATVTVTRSSGMAGAVSVDYATSDATAVSPDDYTPTSGTLNFADGELIKTFTVPIVNDSLVNESQESVNLTLSNPTGGAALGPQATSALLINNSDPKFPATSFSDASVVEGDSGTTGAVFTITLSPHTDVVTVGYATVDGLATAPADYQATSGQLVFNPGENSKTVTVAVNGDMLKEGNEMFFLNLTSQSEGYTLKSQGEGLIIDDDGISSFQFSQPSYSVNEGAGTTTITVNRIGDTTTPATVDYITADHTATQPDDYTGSSGTLNFAAGDTSHTFTVNINDDTKFEGDETFTLKLSNATGGALLGSPSSAEVKIVDNDGPPALSISDISLAEGNNGATQFNFMVSLSASSGLPVTVSYATADASANAGSDYQSASGQLTFAPNQVAKSISIAVNGDTLPEPDENFFINLSNPTNATLAKAQGVGTIQNDDVAPLPPGSVAFSSAVYAVNEGVAQAIVTVKRVGGSSGAVSAQYATTAGGSAVAGADYNAVSGTLNWADGDANDKTFAVPIIDDAINEANETVSLVLSNPAGGASLGSPNSAVLTIVDNDAEPKISIDDVTAAEGNSGTTGFTFTVSLSAASGQTVSVNYTTADNTAQAGSDYQAVNGVVTFAPGEISKQFTVLVNGDTQVEPNENFLVNLYNPVNLSAGKFTGVGTIVNDDSNSPTTTVQFSPVSYSVPEDLGALTVTVTRTGDTSAATSVDYMTTDGSAAQKADFEFAAGTLTFAPGETSKTITVLINEDMFSEGTETFGITLSNPSGATLGGQAVAHITITDDLPESTTSPLDDAQSFVYTHYHDFLNREPDPAGLAFWTNQITSCGTDAGCIEGRRINVSASFFLSIEHQETAYLLYLIQKESYGNMPRYASFMRDLQEVSRGVVVNTPGWQQKLTANQQQFAHTWINRPEFKTVYDPLSNDAYVNALYNNAGVVPPQQEKDKLVAALNGANMDRAAVLLEVSDDVTFRQLEQNAAFVLMEYFGYLRRDPNAFPDSDMSGYNFWLNKLNQFKGNYIDAEMVKAFITSFEYRQRFGQ